MPESLKPHEFLHGARVDAEVFALRPGVRIERRLIDSAALS